MEYYYSNHATFLFLEGALELINFAGTIEKQTTKIFQVRRQFQTLTQISKIQL